MKVRFITLSAGASGVIRPGDIVDVPAGEAELLIRHGYAELVEIPVKPVAALPEEAPQEAMQEAEREVKHRKPRAK